MFKGIISRDNGEPWGHTGMTTAKWKTVEPQPVRIADLIATQPGILLAALAHDWDRTPIGGDPIPHVIRWNGELYLEDGHHRVTRRALTGSRYITARVLDI